VRTQLCVIVTPSYSRLRASLVYLVVPIPTPCTIDSGHGSLAAFWIYGCSCSELKDTAAASGPQASENPKVRQAVAISGPSSDFPRSPAVVPGPSRECYFDFFSSGFHLKWNTTVAITSDTDQASTERLSSLICPAPLRTRGLQLYVY
jgi:hypothetical protein